MFGLKTLLITEIALFCCLILAVSARAEVYLSEVLPDSAPPEDENEFVEICNNGQEAVDLSGWKLDDIAEGGSAAKKIAAGTKIEPGQCLAFFSSLTHISFNNDQDSVNLLNASSTIIDTTSYIGNNNGKTKENWSWSLINSQWQWTSSPTPNSANTLALNETAANPTIRTTPVPTPQPANPELKTEINYLRAISITEILPNPSGSDQDLEFIELHNSNSYAVDLGGWKLDDAEGGSHAYIIPASTTISALGFLAFFSEDTRIALNNTSDEARLFYPKGDLADSKSYNSPIQGFSLAKTEDSVWTWTDSTTPGQPNVFTNNRETQTNTPKPEPEIQETAIIKTNSPEPTQEPKTATPSAMPARQTTQAGITPPPSALLAETQNYSEPKPDQIPLAKVNPQKQLIDFKSAVLISLVLGALGVIFQKKLKTQN